MYAPSIIQMSIVLNSVNLQVVFIKMLSQKFEIFVRNHCVFFSSENVSFERKLSDVIESVFGRNFRSINEFIFCGSIIIFSELAISVCLDPVFYALNRCSSWLVRYQHSQSFDIEVASFCFAAQHVNEVEDDVSVECVMMNEDSHLFVHLLWEV
jgi:hypothetical protein